MCRQSGHIMPSADYRSIKALNKVPPEIMRALWYLLRLSPGCGVVNGYSQDTIVGCWCAPPSDTKGFFFFFVQWRSSFSSQQYTSSVSEYLLSGSDRRSARAWLLYLGLYLHRTMDMNNKQRCTDIGILASQWWWWSCCNRFAINS